MLKMYMTLSITSYEAKDFFPKLSKIKNKSQPIILLVHYLAILLRENGIPQSHEEMSKEYTAQKM